MPILEWKKIEKVLFAIKIGACECIDGLKCEKAEEEEWTDIKKTVKTSANRANDSSYTTFRVVDVTNESVGREISGWKFDFRCHWKWNY